MTRVCLVGQDENNLEYELLSRETARNALATYNRREPFANSVAVETVSLGAAISLCNDLNWYLVRFVEDVLVLEPSVSNTEWLSRDLATAIRDDEIEPADTGRFLKVYGVVEPDDGPSNQSESGSDADESMGTVGQKHQEPQKRSGGEGSAKDTTTDDATSNPTGDRNDKTTDTGRRSRSTEPPRLVEPMYVTQTGSDIPEYDLREVMDTLVVRVSEAEFGP